MIVWSRRHVLVCSMLAVPVVQPQTAAPPKPAAPPSVVAGISVNYDEAAVGSYVLPDPLTMANSRRVRNAKEWSRQRRPEIVRLFEQHQFGRAPAPPSGLHFDVFDKGTPALSGKALRKQVTIQPFGDAEGPRQDLVIYVPANASKPAPLILCLNFSPNAAIFGDDPEVRLGEMWNRERRRVPATRGGGLGRTPVADLLARGFAVAGLYYGDIDPDFPGGIPFGVRARYLKPGQTQPQPDEWGAISAWAWGLSRAMDYLETDKAIDAKRVAIYGVSRLGKTVLWAGARDERFAMVIASCSGEGGAALSRRNYGETVGHLTAPTRYPYQFAAQYGTYGASVDTLPVDGHMLIALMAPRPVLLVTGDKDLWSDPKGEFLAAVAAEPVYELLGRRGLKTKELPGPGQLISHDIGFYMHAGGHGTLPGDWKPIADFVEAHFGKAATN